MKYPESCPTPINALAASARNQAVARCKLATTIRAEAMHPRTNPKKEPKCGTAARPRHEILTKLLGSLDQDSDTVVAHELTLCNILGQRFYARQIRAVTGGRRGHGLPRASHLDQVVGPQLSDGRAIERALFSDGMPEALVWSYMPRFQAESDLVILDLLFLDLPPMTHAMMLDRNWESVAERIATWLDATPGSGNAGRRNVWHSTMPSPEVQRDHQRSWDRVPGAT